MKRILRSAITIITLAIASGCNTKDLVGPKVSGTTVSESYQPVSAGSTWTYTIQMADGSSTTMTIKTTGQTTTINNKKYYNCNSTSPVAGMSGTGYYHQNGDIYRSRSTSAQAGATVDMLYLDNSKPIDSTWTAPVNDSGYINGIAGRFVGKVTGRDLTHTVGGRTFKNVIHIVLDLQYNYGGGYYSTGVYDYYVAKGVGLIELDFSVFGIPLTKQTVTTYDIK